MDRPRTGDLARVELGAVVRDSYGRVGIVCTKESVPDETWISEQLHCERLRELGDTDWWGVAPFGGGYALEAAPLLTYLREATYDDFLEVADTSGPTGRERLIAIFPDYVDRLLAEREKRRTN